MKRIEIVCLAALSAAIVFGEEVKKDVTYPFPPSRMDEFNARTGGMVEPDPNGPKALFLDLRTKAEPAVTNILKGANVFLHVPYVYERGAAVGGDRIYATLAARRTKEHPAVLALIDVPGAPSLAVYPEDAMAIVNVAALAQGSDQVKLRDRLAKEIWRAFGFALGGYAQPMPGCVLQPVYSVEELDALKGRQLAPNRLNGIYRAAGRLGLHSDHPVPYSMACRQGWAPPPTNDVQKALWERFRREREDAKDPTARWRRDFPQNQGK